MNSAPYTLTRDDLVDQLKEQITFLEVSCEAFDRGAEGEAKRLAVAVRILVHDTRSSTSLLTHLKVKDRLSYLDTAAPILPENMATTPGLVGMQMGPDGFKYKAMLDDGPPPA